MSSSVINQFLKPGHQWPHRLVLRNNNDWWRILDLQIKIEQGGLSVFMKPPVEGLFVSKKPIRKLTLPKSGLVNIQLSNNVLEGKVYFNPYLFWHSSGNIHVNAFNNDKLVKDIFMNDSKAVGLKDIKKSPHIILTAILPINSLSYYPTKAPPLEFNSNYLEISDKPYRQNKIDGAGPINIVLDRSGLKSSSIILDVMVHDRNADVCLIDNHPYPNNAEMYFVHLPIKITPDNINLPVISLFFYQPINTTTMVIQKKPITFWGRSKEQKKDIVFQAIKI